MFGRNKGGGRTCTVDTNQHTVTITFNLDEARVHIAQVITFLSLVMPQTLAVRVVAIILLSIGVPRNTIVDLYVCCRRSLCTYSKAIVNGQLESLFTIKKGAGRLPFFSLLGGKNYADEIRHVLDTENFCCAADIQRMLKERFGLEATISTVKYMLKTWGYKWLKCGSIPAKADVVLQREFYDGTLHPAMEDAKAGKIHLFFMDVSHFVFGCDFLGHVWTLARRFVRTYSGRNRYNVLGALDYATKEVVTVTNTSYITATEIVKMLEKLRAKFGNDGLPIRIILDNARYQKCKIVQEAAERLNIELLYIPPYSPNLNLIERLWKYTKSEIRGHIADIQSFEAFQAFIDQVLSETATTRLPRMNKLIGDKVQLFDQANIAPTLAAA